MTNWLIIGVSYGLENALAQAALTRGDAVVGTVRRVAEKRAFEALAPGPALSVPLDLADRSAISEAVANAEAWPGPIDRLVYNAGFGMVGAIAMIQAVQPAMRARRTGHIVTITSFGGFAPWWATRDDGASRYAQECIGQTQAQEVELLDIRVTNIAPGEFRTDFAPRGLIEAATMIDDYRDTALQPKHSLMAGWGMEAGDRRGPRRRYWPRSMRRRRPATCSLAKTPCAMRASIPTC